MKKWVLALKSAEEHGNSGGERSVKCFVRHTNVWQNDEL